tara:strand:+ start:6946 stop:7590 length:645 start_codon:yes stop_codon:yes gene_type:complete
MTTSWADAQKPQTSGRKDIIRLKIDTEKKIRLVGGVLPRYVYWVTTKEGKKMPIECLSFNRDTESMDDSLQDPIKELPDEIVDIKPQFGFICNVIDRDSKEIVIFDLKMTIFKQIVEFAGNPDFGNPADEEKGYDITIKKEKTGPLPQNVKYTCMPGRSNTPLTDKEKEMETFDLHSIYKRPTYDEQRQWLMQHTNFYEGEGGEEFKPEAPEDL